MRETGSEYFLANCTFTNIPIKQYQLTGILPVVTVLNAACQQQPALGDVLSISGGVFYSTTVNITSPTAVPASAAYQPGSSGLTLGAKVGITVGAIVVFLIAIGILIVCRGKRRRKAVLAAHQRASGYLENQRIQTIEFQRNSSYPGQGPLTSPREQFFDSPVSQIPLKRQLSWDYGNSPQSPPPEKAYFSPYQSTYNSPVSALEGPSHASPWQFDSKGMPLATIEPAIEMSDVYAKDPLGPEWQPARPPILQNPRPK